MEKLREILSPGKDKDDAAMYGTDKQGDSSTGPTGKLTGQGSHFDHESSTTGSTIPTSNTNDPQSTTTNPLGSQTHSTGNTAHPSAQLASDPASGADKHVTTQPATGNTTGTTGTINPTGKESSTTGAVPAGAATTAASSAWKSHDNKEGEHVPGSFPTESENPYKTSNLDPRVDSQSRTAPTESTPSQPSTKQDYGQPRTTGNYGGDAGALPGSEKPISGQTGQHQSSTAARDAALATGATAAGTTAAGTTAAAEHGRHAGPTETTPARAEETSNKPSLFERAAGAVGLSGNRKDTPTERNDIDNKPTAASTSGPVHESTRANAPSEAVRGAETRADAPSSTARGAETRADAPSSTARGAETSDDKQKDNSGIAGKAASAAAAGAAAVGITKHEENKHEEKSKQDAEKPDDFHNTWKASPGDSSEREHGKDPSSSVRPTHGSAKAPSFLKDLTGAEPEGVAAGSSTPSQPVTGNPTAYDNPESKSKDHAAERAAETAAGAGAGAAGAGAIAEHESKHHSDASRHPTESTTARQPVGTTQTSQPNVTGASTASSATPAGTTSTSATPSGRTDDRHHGRDAALAGTGVLAGAGAADAASHRHHEPSSRAEGAHDSQRTGPSGVTGTQPPTYSSSTAPVQEPRQTHADHHLGRDAGLAGTGALAGAGAADAASHHPHDSSSRTGGAYDSQRFEPSGTTGTQAPTYPSSTAPVQEPRQAHTDHHHAGRDAAAAGLGGAAVGGAAYEASRHHEGTGPHATQSTQPTHATSTQPTSATRGQDPAYGSATIFGTSTVKETPLPHSEPRHAESTLPHEGSRHAESALPHGESRRADGALAQDQPRHGDDRHLGRDAAAGAAAGAGAGAVAHEFSHKDAEKAEKERAEQQKAQEKEAAKQHKEHEKEVEKEQKAHEKAIAKEEKHQAKEEKKHEKEVAKEREREEKHQEKAAAAEEKEDNKEKKPGLIDRLLHRHKHDDDTVEETDDHKHAKEGAAAVGAAGAAGAGAHEYEKHHGHNTEHAAPGTASDVHGHNKLHKDPPEGYQQQASAGEHPTSSTAADVTGATGATGATALGREQPLAGDRTAGIASDPNAPRDQIASGGVAGDSVTGHGVGSTGHGLGSTAATGSTQREEIGNDPNLKGYAAQVTGGTGTNKLAQGHGAPQGSHLTGAGNTLDPSIRDRASVVTEHHTGLPMDVSKGTGAGGTDAGTQPGYQG